MQNIKQLRETLIENFEGVRNNTMDTKTVSEMNLTAGRIISTLVAELKYQRQQRIKKKIDFLEY